MGVERLQEIIVLAAALACGLLLTFVDPDRLSQRMKSWALALGKFRRPIGVIIILAVTVLAIVG